MQDSLRPAKTSAVAVQTSSMKVPVEGGLAQTGPTFYLNTGPNSDISAPRRSSLCFGCQTGMRQTIIRVLLAGLILFPPEPECAKSGTCVQQHILERIISEIKVLLREPLSRWLSCNMPCLYSASTQTRWWGHMSVDHITRLTLYMHQQSLLFLVSSLRQTGQRGGALFEVQSRYLTHPIASAVLVHALVSADLAAVYHAVFSRAGMDVSKLQHIGTLVLVSRKGHVLEVSHAHTRMDVILDHHYRHDEYQAMPTFELCASAPGTGTRTIHQTLVLPVTDQSHEW